MIESITRSPPTVQRTKQHGPILNAAEQCFTSFGFHRTTMQIVAQEAGMSQENLYRYFSSKNATVEGLVQRAGGAARPRFALIDPTHQNPIQFPRRSLHHETKPARCGPDCCGCHHLDWFRRYWGQ